MPTGGIPLTPDMVRESGESGSRLGGSPSSCPPCQRARVGARASRSVAARGLEQAEDGALWIAHDGVALGLARGLRRIEHGPVQRCDLLAARSAVRHLEEAHPPRSLLAGRARAEAGDRSPALLDHHARA